MKRSNVQRIVGTALLAAIVVVLQLLASTLTIGSFSFALVLIPIVLGAATYGVGTGVILGAVFGLITYIGCINGTDPGGNMLFVANPFWCALICFGKGALAGVCSALVYRAVAKKAASARCVFFAVLLAAITAPFVNTGVFLIGMVTFFTDTLRVWAGGTNAFNYMIFTLAGVNFLIELALNIVFVPAICAILRAVKRKTTQ